MEVPMINRISEFDVGINSIRDPAFLSQAFAVSGVGKLHHAYSFWKWGALLLIAFVASFTSVVTKIKSFILRLRRFDESLPSLTLLCDYDSDSDSSCSSDESDDECEDDDDSDEEDEDDSVSKWRPGNGDLIVEGSGQGINGQSSRGSFSDFFSWPDLAGLGSTGVVKLWDSQDINGGSRSNAVASFLGKCSGASLFSSPAVLVAAEKRGCDAVEVKAWDTRAGFRMPSLIAEWRQPGRFLGKINVGDMRMLNDAFMELTESDVVQTY